IQPHEYVCVSGIGCSGKISQFMATYGFHGVHGRTLPVATAVKLANRDLLVVAAGGDGDGYGIGIGHLMHAIRRNIDITYVVMDNRSEEHTSELQSRENLVCRLLLEKK